MKASTKAFDTIKEFEGCELKAYPDPASGGKPYTIGYGHTKGVKLGDVISKFDADQFLKEDVEVVEDWLNKYCNKELTQGQFDALVSFAFNLGIEKLQRSTLWGKVQSGDFAGAALEFPKWKLGAGKVMPGLVRRRAAEKKLFES